MASVNVSDLVHAGGTGDAADVACVAAAIAKLPAPALAILRAKGVMVVACRNSVTDHADYLRGVHPRGWLESGHQETWDVVPGAFLPKSNEVVIGTIATAAGRALPDQRTQGSCNIAVHETMHGVDYAFNRQCSKNPRFTAARDADIALGHISQYERQAGDAGLEETYAESAARSFSHIPTLDQTPGLAAFWADAHAWDTPPDRPESDAVPIAPRQLYVGEKHSSGAETTYDLVATGVDGEIGHLILTQPRLESDAGPVEDADGLIIVPLG